MALFSIDLYSTGKPCKIVAIVSDMERERLDVVDTDDGHNTIPGLNTLGNAGFTLARRIHHATTLINANPNGYPCDALS